MPVKFIVYVKIYIQNKCEKEFKNIDKICLKTF